MGKSLEIKEYTKKATVDLVIDTLERKKQALVFVNSKRSAEKTAEDIAKNLDETQTYRKIAYELETALPRPTSQCKKLGEVAKKGVVFHHAGLLSKQREIIEDYFRSGELKIICSTPTLAAGLDMPAFRAIIKDLKRYAGRGMDYIPVMEYHQMAGRAGRPGKEDFGEAIIISNSEKDKEVAIDKFIMGEPEDILSKLAVEPVLRTYLLSLIATEFVRNREEIFEFFSKTFWAHQFQDMERIKEIILRMLRDLEVWNFIEIEGENGKEKKNETNKKEKKKKGVVDSLFTSALKIKETKEEKDTSRIKATLIGKRVAELYLDPLTAHEITEDLRKAQNKDVNEFTFLFSICKTLEMYPLLPVRTKDYEVLALNLDKYKDHIVDDIPEDYEEEYTEFLASFKTAYLLKHWIDEKEEEDILNKFSVRPGELHIKVTNGDWLLYATEELCRLLNIKELLNEISKTRIRLKYGVKEEIIRLLKLKNVGRVRARKLYEASLTDLGKIRKANINELAKIVGPNLAINIKEQLGEDVKVKPTAKESKKGQHSLLDY